MSADQMGTMTEMAASNIGLILVVGPTGSGKTTSLYSLISSIDTKSRSLISIEDPVEYTIPYANQQEVSEKIGNTFENRLRSALRQDPDILFIGEIRDRYSAKMAVQASSTGHLCLSTMHTLNATTAIFRFENLDISRLSFSEAILGIVAQRLVKRLCAHCKIIRDISPEETRLFKDYTKDIPTRVAESRGCPLCHNSGYHGRTEENPALLKIKNILPLPFAQQPLSPLRQRSPQKILVVDDDKDLGNLVCRYLESEAYEPFFAMDGIDALMHMARTPFDLILAAIAMPNLNGLQLLEILRQKGIRTPVIFITARTSEEVEMKAFALGAVDYIKKPFLKEILLLRIKKVLQSSPQAEKFSSPSP